MILNPFADLHNIPRLTVAADVIAREAAEGELSDVETDAVYDFILAAMRLDTIAADRRSAFDGSVVHYLAENLHRIEELGQQLHVAAVYGRIDMPVEDPDQVEDMLSAADRIPLHDGEDYEAETPVDQVPRIWNVTRSGEVA